MSVLTRPALQRAMNSGKLLIRPKPQEIGTNSIDLTLADELLVYETQQWVERAQGVREYRDEPLDMRRDNRTKTIKIGEGGYVLRPGVLYLGSTVERTYTTHYVPEVSGRSSVGRLGISVHQTAGQGHVGFSGHWTLEISALHPVRIYAGVRICQLRLLTITDQLSMEECYRGRYQHQTAPTPSRLHRDEKDD